MRENAHAARVRQQGGFINISNWVFNTSFKPTTTKELYVQTIYALWQLSKYNPYNEDGSIKSNTITMIQQDALLASFLVSNNALFKYTYEIAYNTVYDTPDPNHPSVTYIHYPVKRENSAPILIPYESSKFTGIFFDNFNFKFNGSKIQAYQSLELPYTSPGITGTAVSPDKNIDVLYGTYDIYQPVSLLSTNLETKSVLSIVRGDGITVNGNDINSLIPIFVLKFIDDDGDRSDIETVIGYVVDLVTTFTGIGNLSKLRHLRWAAVGAETTSLFTIGGLKLVVGGVEFISGVLRFFANFVE